MRRRYLFFDVDGTLLPFGSDFPQNTLEALREAKSLGHGLFLSTGRSPVELDPRLRVIDFDGGVYSGGARAFVDGRDIYASYIPASVVSSLIGICADRGWHMLLQCDSASYCARGFKEVFSRILLEHVGHEVSIQNIVEGAEVPVRCDATKVLLVTPEGDMASVPGLLPPSLELIGNTVGAPQSLIGELCQRGVDKGVAMLKVLEACGGGVEDSIAFGDGANDFPSLAAAGIGVAMGNADDELKGAADFVTRACDDDGIGWALRQLGVLDGEG